MALSEHEQRLLEEMERGLYASEADSLKTRSGSPNRPSYRATLVGALGFIAGVGALIGAVASGQIWIGMIGFALMLGAILYAFSPKNQIPLDQKGQAARSDESFAQRAERRWEERLDGDR